MSKDILSLISGAIKARDFLKLQSLILPLKSYILELEDMNVTLKKENLDCKEQNVKLQAKISEYEQWETEKQKYEIVERSGGFVYLLKGTNQVFCPVCFVNKKIPIHLQPFQYPGDIQELMVCPNCKSEFKK